MDMTREQISEATGFDAGDEFENEDQVRQYFTVAEQAAMHSGDGITDQALLDAMADAVIEHKWHCVWGPQVADGGGKYLPQIRLDYGPPTRGCVILARTAAGSRVECRREEADRLTPAQIRRIADEAAVADAALDPPGIYVVCIDGSTWHWYGDECEHPLVGLRFRVERGAYQGTSDDRADRWYVVDSQATVVDRRGEGYATQQEAEDAAAEAEAMAAWADAQG